MASFDLESLMQPEEARRIGINAMPEAQRQALAEWGLRMFSMGQIVVGNIAEVKYGGRLVVLDDGSRWEVDEFDDTTADFWAPQGRIVVIDNEMYLLDDLEKVHVQPEV